MSAKAASVEVLEAVRKKAVVYGPSYYASKLGDPYEPNKAVMRMAWDTPNLFNMWQRNIGPLKGQYSFARTKDTIHQNQFFARKQLRGYWGQRLKERPFRRWYLPSQLPLITSGEKTNPNISPAVQAATKFSRPGKEGGRRQIEKEQLYRNLAAQAPIGPFMFREIERRLDHVLFRACFTTSQHKAQQMVKAGHVRLNGNIEKQYQIRLLPGDFLEVNPAAIPFLRRPPINQVALAGSRSLGLDFDKDEGWAILLREYAGLTDEAQIAQIIYSKKFAGMTLEQWEAGEMVTEDGKAVKEPTEEEIQKEESKEEPEAFEEPPISSGSSIIEEETVVEKETAPTTAEDLPSSSSSESELSPSESESTSSETDSKPLRSKASGDFPKILIKRSPPTSFKPLTPTHFPPTPEDHPSTLHFHLPAYSGPSLFVPAYIQPNWDYCTITYLRHPTARHNYCEIPSPFNAKGDVMRAGWEWYQKRKIRMRTYAGGLYPGGIDARARLGKLRGPETRRTGVHEEFY